MPVWARNPQLWGMLGATVLVLFMVMAPVVKFVAAGLWSGDGGAVPECYNRARLGSPGVMQLTGSRGPLISKRKPIIKGSHDYYAVIRKQNGMNFALEGVVKAMRYCTAERCPQGALEAYDRYLSRYIKERTWLHHILFRDYGDPGLDWGRRIVANRYHDRLAEGLRERVEAGVYDISRHQYSTAMRILVYGTKENFLPCRSDA